MKKMNNKGFSLIELIIVIAIMAILVAIIAPNLTKYLGSSKKQTDEKNLDEVKAQVKNCISDASIDNITVGNGSGTSWTYIYNGATKTCTLGGTVDSFGKLVVAALDGSPSVSKQDANKKTVAITISVNSNGGYDVTASHS